MPALVLVSSFRPMSADMSWVTAGYVGAIKKEVRLSSPCIFSGYRVQGIHLCLSPFTPIVFLKALTTECLSSSNSMGAFVPTAFCSTYLHSHAPANSIPSQFFGSQNEGKFGSRNRLQTRGGAFFLLRRNFVGVGPRADSEREEEGLSREEVNGRASLSRLDEQLRTLSSSDTSAPVAIEPSKPRESVEKLREEDKSDGRVEWPTFSDNFLAITGVGLLILTVVNNILFRVFIGPPIPHLKKPQSAPTKQFKLHSNSEPSNLEAPPLVD